MSRIVVQKFGGSSVADVEKIRKVAARVKARRDEGWKLVVVVSAMGDTTDEPPLLYGEWGLLSFSNPSANATLDLSFYGLGVFVIVDDDHGPKVL